MAEAIENAGRDRNKNDVIGQGPEKFCPILRNVARLRSIALATRPRSSRIITTSAVSMAMSVPVPTAIPTSAAASAGASLMPSPTKAILPACDCKVLTAAALPSGRTSASTLSMPSERATASAVPCRSPLTIAISTPLFLRAAIAVEAEALTGSAIAMIAAAR